MGEFCGEVMIMWKGIDVSDNQGAINWAQIPKNVDFAILRSVRRSGKADHQFAANLEGCRKRNIPMSVYKYTYAATPEAATGSTAGRSVATVLWTDWYNGLVGRGG